MIVRFTRKSLRITPVSTSRFRTPLSHGLDERVAEFLSRPIELEIPYLFVDATYVKIRENCRYVTKALFIAVGIRTDGHREILGARIADSESENWWEVMFDELKERGLRGVKLVISDGHKGIRNAVESSFLGAAWQMCTVHYARAVRKKVPKKIQKEIAASLRDAEEDPEKLERIVQSLEELGYQSAANTVERFLHNIGNYRSFPEMHWKRIRTTNGVERINAEMKRRVR